MTAGHVIMRVLSVGSLALSLALAASAGLAAPQQPAPPPALAQLVARDTPIIADHTTTHLGEIPAHWIEQAKATLRLSFGHTSHGSQIISGMSWLRNTAYGGLYAFNTNGAITAGVLSLADYTPSGGDLGNPNWTWWADATRVYLNTPGNNRNVVVWSWCGQVSSATAANINTYLSLMNQLESDFPNVTFVYMTGHLDGSGVAGNLNQRNEQIRSYVRANNKVLFDFADIESYNPDGAYFLDKVANDNNDYSGGNWAQQWCALHPGQCSACSCAHSQSLNCDLKARAFWWLLARLAGWDGAERNAYKTASSPLAAPSQTVTYTVAVRALPVISTTSVLLTDTLPAGLSYVPGSLTSTSGSASATLAPTLTWSGVVTPHGAITITYAAQVTTAGPPIIRNDAVMVPAGYPAITRTAAVGVNGHAMFLPLVVSRRF